jgi:hypothetical protein
MLGTLLSFGLLTAAGFTVKVPSAVIVKRIKTIFSEVKLTLGPDLSGLDGKPISGSLLEFGPALNRKKVTFSVPEKRVDLGLLGTLIYSPNGIFIRDTSVRATAKEYEVVLYFASDGPALKGKHSWLGDGGAPDINLDNAHVIVRMRPVARDGKITFQKPTAMFYADMRTEGLSFNVLGRQVDLVQSATGYRDQIKNAIESQLVAALDGSGARQLLSDRIQDIVQAEAAKFNAKVTGLGLSGMDLAIMLAKRGEP